MEPLQSPLQSKSDASADPAQKPVNNEPRISATQQQTLEKELFQRAGNVSREDEKVVVEELPGKVNALLESVNQRLPLVKNMLTKVKTLYAMLRDKNFALAWSSKTVLIAGLLYFISPIDLLPDYIPMLGYVDDAFVISIVMNALAAEIERYKEFKQPQQQAQNPLEPLRQN